MDDLAIGMIQTQKALDSLDELRKAGQGNTPEAKAALNAFNEGAKHIDDAPSRASSVSARRIRTEFDSLRGDHRPSER